MSEPQYGAKTAQIKLKFRAGENDLPEGEFIAYAAVFDVKDLVGDIIRKGAFTKTLADWAAKGNTIPLLWSHNTADPDFNLGEVISAEEDEHGLKVHGRLDMDSPKAPATYRLLKGGRVTQMSFAYKVTDGGFVTHEDTEAFEIRGLDLFEVSVVQVGANQATEVLAVKTAAQALAAQAKNASSKSMSAIEAAKAALSDALECLQSVLPDDPPTGEKMADVEDQDVTSGKEPPTGTKSDPATPTPSVALALTMIEIESQREIEA